MAGAPVPSTSKGWLPVQSIWMVTTATQPTCGVEWTMMNRTLAAFAATIGAALLLPAFAPATLTEVGNSGPDPTPSCPARPCHAVIRTTRYQAKIGTKRGIEVIPADCRIVAWTIGLGKPGKKQTTFFEKNLGGESQAQITILRPRRKLRARVMAQGELVKLKRYFGSTVQFALEKSIPVKKGWVVALTVPTWAPALAVGLPGDTSWRASRGKGKCDDTSAQTAQKLPNQLAQYYCLYRTARLTYSATLVPDPQPPKEQKTAQ
jgi:hypothetical protein